jgi:enolase 1/2/3
MSKLDSAADLTASTIILKVHARQVLDSRGNPTVEAEVSSKGGAHARAIVPSGASTGAHEAVELRDGDQKLFGGKSVLKAVSNVNERIGPKLMGRSCLEQEEIDRLMIELDGTANKQNLGANAILSVSMAVAKSAAQCKEESLYQYLNPSPKHRLPVPMMNVINGGMHAGNSLAIQEFHIEPIGAKSCSEAIRFGDEVYQALKVTLKEKYGPSAINVGDEGGYAPPLQTSNQALDAIQAAVKKVGYSETEIMLGLDAASSSFFSSKESTYQIDGRSMTADSLEEYYVDLADRYPLHTLEDPFEDDAFEDFARITARLGKRLKIIGDDIYVTNTKRLKRGIQAKATNAVLIKLNQIGTVTETLEAINLAKSADFDNIVSHRSGDTEDTFISHLATAVESSFIKTGAPARSERTAKYNELLRIEEELGGNARFAGASSSS